MGVNGNNRHRTALRVGSARVFAGVHGLCPVNLNEALRPPCASADGGKMRQPACKPGSVGPRGCATRQPFIWDARRRTPRATYPDGALEHRAQAPMPSLFGLAPGGVYRAATVTGRAVGSYPTLSPLPAGIAGDTDGRFAFCGTFPGVAPAGRYPAPLLLEPGLSSAPAFRHPDAAAARPTGPFDVCPRRRPRKLTPRSSSRRRRPRRPGRRAPAPLR